MNMASKGLLKWGLLDTLEQFLKNPAEGRRAQP